ncbi:MAG: sugar kinase, partial [Planctomyces sp.]
NGQVKPWEIRQIVDRVGSGDAFDAGILLGLLQSDFNPEWTVEFATAASCLAHSIVGDWNYASRSEIEALMHGSGSGKVVR